jgi:outer membrane protein TolC
MVNKSYILVKDDIYQLSRHNISTIFNLSQFISGLNLKFIVITISIYLNLFLCISTYSQPDSLMQYLELSAKNNPLVLQKFAEYEASLQKVPQVGSLPDPELSAGVFLSPMELVSGNQVADIRLMQMFPWFGVLKNAKDEMSLMAKAKYESFRDTKLQLFYNVQRTWYELQKVKQDILISEKNLEIMKTIERLALVRFKSPATGSSSSSYQGASSLQSNSQTISAGSSGMQSMSGNSGTAQSQQSAPMQSNFMSPSSGGSGLADLYRIQIETGELENDIKLLKSQENTIAARFNSYLNRPVESVVTLPDTLRPDTLTIPLQAVSDSMLENSPMLGMLQYEKQSIEARKKMVTKMGYPMVGFGVDYSLINKSAMSTSSMNGKDMIMPMVTVTLPIYRKKYKAMQNEADLLKSANEQGFKATSNGLQTEYYEAVQLYRDALRRIEQYKNQSFLASKSLDIMIKSFSVSGAGLTDILRVRQQMLDYLFKQTESVADYNTSIAWLKRLMALQ